MKAWLITWAGLPESGDKDPGNFIMVLPGRFGHERVKGYIEMMYVMMKGSDAEKYRYAKPGRYRWVAYKPMEARTKSRIDCITCGDMPYLCAQHVDIRLEIDDNGQEILQWD